jgi:tetratricopeptide (TPR) repeat protein/DNA-binding CsgD family transcriptional regulator
LKSLFSYCFLLTLLLVFLQPVNLHPQYHNTDSLRQIIRAGPGSLEGLQASILLAQEMMPAQMDSARILIERAHPLENSTVLRHQAQYHNVWGLYYWFQRDRQASINNYKKTLALPENESIISLQAAAANNIGGHYSVMGEPDSARVYLMKSLDIDTRRGHETGMAKTYYDLSSLHRRLDQHELALRYITEAIRIQEADGDKERLMHSYNMLGNVFVSLGDAAKATDAYERSQAMARELDRQRTVIMMYSNLSAIWCTREDGFDKTLTYFENGIDKARESGQTDMVATLMGNMGTAWLTAGEAERALEYFRDALGLTAETKRLFSEMELSFRMGQAYRQLGQFGNARQYQQNSLNLARQMQSVHNQSRALLEMAALDSLQGDYRGFSQKYIQGVKLRDSIWNNENRSRIAELQIIHDIEQKEVTIAKLEQQNRMSRFRQRTIMVVGLLVISPLVTALLYIQKRRMVGHQNIIIKEQEKEKIEAELESHRRELTGKALSLAKSDQLIKQLKQDIQAVLARSDNKSCDELRSALRMLKTTQNSQVLWKDFETRFNELNEGFISRLTGLYPTLSPAEIRLCAMLRLQMSTKDVAEMIKRSTRTIEYTRNNARSKMGLRVGDNLVQHLLNI